MGSFERVANWNRNLPDDRHGFEDAHDTPAGHDPTNEAVRIPEQWRNPIKQTIRIPVLHGTRPGHNLTGDVRPVIETVEIPVLHDFHVQTRRDNEEEEDVYDFRSVSDYALADRVDGDNQNSANNLPRVKQQPVAVQSHHHPNGEPAVKTSHLGPSNMHYAPLRTQQYYPGPSDTNRAQLPTQQLAPGPDDMDRTRLHSEQLAAPDDERLHTPGQPLMRQVGPALDEGESGTYASAISHEQSNEQGRVLTRMSTPAQASDGHEERAAANQPKDPDAQAREVMRQPESPHSFAQSTPTPKAYLRPDVAQASYPINKSAALQEPSQPNHYNYYVRPPLFNPERVSTPNFDASSAKENTSNLNANVPGAQSGRHLGVSGLVMHWPPQLEETPNPFSRARVTFDVREPPALQYNRVVPLPPISSESRIYPSSSPNLIDLTGSPIPMNPSNSGPPRPVNPTSASPKSPAVQSSSLLPPLSGNRGSIDATIRPVDPTSASSQSPTMQPSSPLPQMYGDRDDMYAVSGNPVYNMQTSTGGTMSITSGPAHKPVADIVSVNNPAAQRNDGSYVDDTQEGSSGLTASSSSLSTFPQALYSEQLVESPKQIMYTQELQNELDDPENIAETFNNLLP
ncbi:hypothetical protein F5890DRAFT_249578 [Lentinula detonsa]|uniref:Uncharacterized protein n=1 Tax=Lentinula detonsa TaxID=2804962 RepID=A0AA38PXC8_9AGAR|nr:hypothetical protein F5890DRAFT_249578 [Lentinula detonsa]